MNKHNYILKPSLLKLLILILVVFSCSDNKKDIQVAVAANFASTMKEIVDSFKVHVPDAGIKIVHGSSGKLTGQILNGADFDIFLSADLAKPEILYEKGFTKSKPVTYAFGSLVLFTKQDIKLSPDLSSINDESIKHIAIANPKLAPYGAASIEAIKNAGIEIDTSKYVYGENIIQTFQHISLAADIGFISKSLIYQGNTTGEFIEGKHWVEVDTSLYSPIKQAMIILNDESAEVVKLYDYIQSDEAKKIMIKKGYTF
ncbi:MAG: molybdate ABC transporter substrate-binding protein [Ignavibacteria bacterium]|jgi:molybdate transport system substrate-binding protein